MKHPPYVPRNALPDFVRKLGWSAGTGGLSHHLGIEGVCCFFLTTKALLNLSHFVPYQDRSEKSGPVSRGIRDPWTKEAKVSGQELCSRKNIRGFGLLAGQIP